jgi:hypothetical protein
MPSLLIGSIQRTSHVAILRTTRRQPMRTLLQQHHPRLLLAPLVTVRDEKSNGHRNNYNMEGWFVASVAAALMMATGGCSLWTFSGISTQHPMDNMNITHCNGIVGVIGTEKKSDARSVYCYRTTATSLLVLSLSLSLSLFLCAW